MIEPWYPVVLILVILICLCFARLLLAMVGLAPMGGYQRFTFGFAELTGGLSFVPMLIGLFALSEGFRQVEIILTAPRVSVVLANILPTLRDLKECLPAYLRACPIGLVVGITPAIGADTAAFLSYAETKRASKRPESFGKGNPAGVAAAQCGENASTGGDVLPMITLGIPGYAATAVLMGALTIHNLQPGPMLFQGHPEVVHQIFAGMISANVVFVILGLIFARFFAQVINIDRKYLVPLILITCMVGSYSINNVLYDLATCAIFGFLGYLMIRYDFPVAPMVLAQILGSMMESNYRRAVVMFHGDVTLFFTRPIALTILALAAFTTIVAVRRQRQALKQEAAHPDGPDQHQPLGAHAARSPSPTRHRGGAAPASLTRATRPARVLIGVDPGV